MLKDNYESTSDCLREVDLKQAAVEGTTEVTCTLHKAESLRDVAVADCLHGTVLVIGPTVFTHLFSGIQNIMTACHAKGMPGPTHKRHGCRGGSGWMRGRRVARPSWAGVPWSLKGASRSM